jgi:hypothetical protein
VNKTTEYAEYLNEKIGVTKGYYKCYECFEEIIDILGNVKDGVMKYAKNYKNKIVNETVYLIEKIEDSAVVHFFEDINVKLIKFKEKVDDLLDLNEMNWDDSLKPRRLRRWPLFVFLVSAIICLSSSAIFHWFSAHSKTYFEFLNRLDYAGISILIAGSCFPPYYYFFYCEPCNIFN